MLPHVPFDGWTRRALRAGLADIGMAPEDAEQLFPGGAADMIEAFCDWADRRMEEGAAALDPALRLHQRVRAVIALRLEQNRPHKEAIRRALALLALPGTCAAGRGVHRAHGGCDLACGGRSVGGFQLVHQAGDPRRGVWRDAAVLAARFQRRRCGDAGVPRPATGRRRADRLGAAAGGGGGGPVAAGVTPQGRSSAGRSDGRHWSSPRARPGPALDSAKRRALGTHHFRAMPGFPEAPPLVSGFQGRRPAGIPSASCLPPRSVLHTRFPAGRRRHRPRLCPHPAGLQP